MPNLNTEETELRDMQLISATDITKICTLSRTNLFEQEAAGTFPARVLLSKGRFAYKLSEIETWLNNKFADRDIAAATIGGAK